MKFRICRNSGCLDCETYEELFSANEGDWKMPTQETGQPYHMVVGRGVPWNTPCGDAWTIP